MIYTIENNQLRVRIDTLGAQLSSIYFKATDTEYLWQGDEKYWKGRAYNLFPYVGRLAGGKYVVNGKEYAMDRHGFVRGMEFVVSEKTNDSISFTVSATDKTKLEFPFNFIFIVRFSLNNNKLTVAYFIKNIDDKTMYFGLGGHPGFNLPFDGGEFEDYFVEFENECSPTRIIANDKGLITPLTEKMQLAEGKRINLKHNLFDNDAIIMQTDCRCVYLKANQTKKNIKVSFPKMSNLGLWHMPKTDAPFICIEPWLTLPANDGNPEVLETKKNVGVALAGEIYENYFEIEING